MKKHFVVFSSLLFLAACSSDSGSKSPAINPLAKPSNPAPKEYLAQVVQVIQGSDKFLPSNEALFTTVIDGEDLKTVYEGSSDQREALNKLNSTGSQFRDQIKRNCTLTPATKFETGGQPATGVTTIKRLKLSSSGANCPYIVDQGLEMKAYYTELTTGANQARMNVTMSRTQTTRREVKDANMVKQSGVASFDFTFKIDANINANYSANAESMTINGTFGGNLKVLLANGDLIAGPISGTMNSQTQSTDARGKGEFIARFEGTSSKGDVWVTVVMKEGVNKVYVNGEEVDASGIGGFGKVLDHVDMAL